LSPNAKRNDGQTFQVLTHATHIWQLTTSICLANTPKYNND